MLASISMNYSGAPFLTSPAIMSAPVAWDSAQYALFVFIATIIPTLIIGCGCLTCCCCSFYGCSAVLRGRRHSNNKTDTTADPDDTPGLDEKEKNSAKRIVIHRWCDILLSEPKRLNTAVQQLQRSTKKNTPQETTPKSLSQKDSTASDNPIIVVESDSASSSLSSPTTEPHVILVLKIDATTKPSHVAKIVTWILSQQRYPNRVVCLIHTPGGSVSHYGQIHAELMRLGRANIPTTACIDQLAASGGYMIACACQEIVAAPQALVGSIGVIAQYTNVKGLSDRVGVRRQTITAGLHKQSYDMFEDNSEERIEHVQRELAQVHQMFKRIVQKARPKADMAVVAEGDAWSAKYAKRYGLVDSLMTSQQYLSLQLTKDHSTVDNDNSNNATANPKKVVIFTVAYKSSSSRSISSSTGILSSLLRHLLPSWLKPFAEHQKNNNNHTIPPESVLFTLENTIMQQTPRWVARMHQWMMS